MLNKAIEIAVYVHKGQFDKSGEIPYIEHPLFVMNAMGPHASQEEKAVAVLHDAIEDGGDQAGTYEDIYNACGATVANSVAVLTHAKGMSYMEYIKLVSSDPIATRVKIQDILHNTSLDRYKSLKGEQLDKFLEKIKTKYIPAIIHLTNTIEAWQKRG